MIFRFTQNVNDQESNPVCVNMVGIRIAVWRVSMVSKIVCLVNVSDRTRAGFDFSATHTEITQALIEYL
jgi:hypothetical protein